MNIRGTDSTALAAVTELFVAPTAQRDGGAGGFQQALQPPRPYEPLPTAAPRQDSQSPSQKTTKEAKTPTADSPACEHVVCRDEEPNSAEGGAEVAAEQTAAVADEPTEVATSEPPIAEDADDEQNVAAESLAAVAVALAEQHLPEQQLPAVATEAIATEPIGAEPASNDESPLPTAIDSLALASATLEQPVENAAATVALATVENPAVAEAIPELLADEITAEGSEPAAGIGVLPSAIAPQATNTSNSTMATRTKAKAASSAQIHSQAANGSIQSTSAESAQETAAVDSAATLTAGETKITNNDSNAGSKKKEQPFFGVDNSPPNAILQPTEVSAVPELNSEIPTTAEVPVVSELHSTQNQAADATKLTTTQPLSTAAGSSRLPAQALVRGTPQEKTPAPLHVDAARFLQRVTKAFESARERGGEIRLRLSPPELGALRVEVNMSEHGLAARVEVETNDARTILLENLPALRERLAEQGLRLEKFDVELSQREPEQRGGNWPDQSRERQSPPEARAVRSPIARPSVVATTQTEIAPTTGWQERQLNVIV
jgi:flagellar hook-length control protein FliK